MLIVGAIQLKKALLYILMQLIGGAMAAGIFRVNNYMPNYFIFLYFSKAFITYEYISSLSWWCYFSCNYQNSKRI
jgi:glycerol uptake facilitator-like aquaporin